MRRLLLACLIAWLGSFIVYAVTDPECVRPIPDDLYEYKEAYVPIEFDHEPFKLEIADVVVLAAMLAVASLLSVRHHPRCRFTALAVVGLAYFGLFRGGCICPVGATTNFCIGLAAPELIGKTVAILFLLPLITAFFFGRVFCSSACPIGAVQKLLARKDGYQISTRLNNILNLLPFALLAATVWGALRGGMFIACKLDVYKLIFFSGYAWINQFGHWLRGTLAEPRVLLVGDVFSWLTLAIILLLGVFVPRPFCRYLCPYGVLLGFFSKIGLRKRHIDAESCFACVMCTKTCPVQAISADPMKRVVKVSNFHCVQCGRCDDTCTGNALGTPSPYPDTAFPNIGKKQTPHEERT
jgi:polyferredoxin